MKEVVINNPYDVVALLSKYRKKRVEYFGVVGVDAGRNVMFQKNLFIGSSAYAFVDPKIVFWELCSRKASAFIVYHNHPSGNSSPSEDDIKLTKRLFELGYKMGLSLLDHVILTKTDYYSLMERGNIESIDNEIAKKVAEE